MDFPKRKDGEPLNIIFWPQEFLNLSRTEIRIPKCILSLFNERMCTLIPQSSETNGRLLQRYVERTGSGLEEMKK